MALDAPGEQQQPIHTYGPLIHNPQVLELFEKRGIGILNQIPEKGEGTVIIRAHGVPRDAKEKLVAAGFNVIDATCPRVIRVQTIIRVHEKKGYTTIIIGDRDHPEVVGLMGYTGTTGHVVCSMDELADLPAFEKAIIVAQTTQNTRFYEDVKKWAEKNHPDYKVFDTICDSTEKRQEDVKRMSENVDAVVVVGGKNSGNTQRLAEIAKETGKSAFHVETEKDLDAKALSSMKLVGITAGASTPNWVIKKVLRTIESMPLDQEKGIRRYVFLMVRALLLTNIFVALGAGCLCYACSILIGVDRFLPYVMTAVFYVLSMHTLNNLTGTEGIHYNDPLRAGFYNRHKKLLIMLTVVSGLTGIVVAWFLGMVSFLILLAMSLLGLSYNIHIIPESRVTSGMKYRKIKDIPGSKTTLIALAWGVVSALLPGLYANGIFTGNTGIVFLWATGFVFCRTAFFDLMDIQGDKIVGRETIAVLLGEKRSIRILKTVLATAAGVMILISTAGLVSALGFVLAICPVLMLLIITAFEKKQMLPGMRLEFAVESLFVMTGIIAGLWELSSA